MLALLGVPAAAAGAAAARVLAGRLRLSAAIAAPLGRRWLGGRAWASARLLGVLRPLTVGSADDPRLAAQVPFSCSQDELDDDLADELGDVAAQLVSDKMLQWSLGWRGHAWSLRPRFLV